MIGRLRQRWQNWLDMDPMDLEIRAMIKAERPRRKAKDARRRARQRHRAISQQLRNSEFAERF